MIKIKFKTCLTDHLIRFYSTKIDSIKWPSNKIRKTFINYFIDNHDHVFVKSSSIIPDKDPSLVFTNAGMNQFKSILLNELNQDDPMSKLKRAVNTQKCIRIGGRLCDFNLAGRDFTHHTFFEMCGSWSFGDYHKKEACSMAWDLLTNVFKLNPNNLYVTYFGGCKELGLTSDEETREIWSEIGLMPSRIIAKGADDNFWDMSYTGPCGPCTEIYYTASPTDDLDTMEKNSSEIWNIVFINSIRQKNLSLKSLPVMHIDTGMGFERIVSILQGTSSNYDTDLFRPLILEIEKVSKVKPYGGALADPIDISYRIVSDYSRMFTVSIADGATPLLKSSWYFVRRMIKMATWVLKNNLNVNQPITLLKELSKAVSLSLSEAYPEIEENLPKVLDTIENEALIFESTMIKAAQLFNEQVKHLRMKGIETFPTSDALYFYEHLSCFEDILLNLLSKHNMKFDWKGFNNAVEQKRIRMTLTDPVYVKSKLDIYGGLIESLKQSGVSLTEDHFKYENLYQLEDEITAIVKDGELIDEVKPGDKCSIVTSKTIFYSNAGGQTSDKGFIICDAGSHFDVNDVYKVDGIVFHEGVVKIGNIFTGMDSHMEIEFDHRQGSMANHTCSHLLESALKLVSSPDLAQSSSKIEPNSFTFEFTPKKFLNAKELKSVESLVNNWINNDYEVITESFQSQQLPNDVLLLPNMAYPEVIRTISIYHEDGKNVSRAACCGTHVSNTKDIKSFVITTHQAGYIRGVTGEDADNAVVRGNKALSDAKLQIAEIRQQLRSMEKGLIKSKFTNYSWRITELSRNLQKLVIPVEHKQQIEKLIAKTKSYLDERRIKDELFVEFDGIPEKSDEVFQLKILRTQGRHGSVLKEALKHCRNDVFLLFHAPTDLNHCCCRLVIPIGLVCDEAIAEGYFKTFNTSEVSFYETDSNKDDKINNTRMKIYEITFQSKHLDAALNQAHLFKLELTKLMIKTCSN